MSVDFEPRTTRPAGRAVPVLVLAITGVIGLALLKPWAGQGVTSPSRAPQAAVPPAPNDPSPPAVSAPAVSAPARRPPPWVDPRLPRAGAVARIVRPHDAWGVRLIVSRRPGSGSPLLEEVWLPASSPLPQPVPTLGEREAGALVFEVGDQAVRLIGVTSPPGASPAQVRVLVARPLGRTADVAVADVPVGRGDDLGVVHAPLTGALWPPGIYQLLIDAGGTQTGITIAIFRDTPADPSSR